MATACRLPQSQRGTRLESPVNPIVKRMSSINLRFGEKGANRVLQHRCVSYEFLDYERELDRDNLIEFFFQNTIYVIDSLCIQHPL